MALTRRTVVGTYLNPDGTPKRGYIEFTPSCELVERPGARIPPIPTRVDLDANGSFSVDLLTTDNATLDPTGWKWVVDEKIEGCRPWYLDVPTSGTPLDISYAFLPNSSGDPVYAVAGPQGPVGETGPQGPVGEVTTAAMNAAITNAIATEVTNRDTAISTAIFTEVTNRNAAISAAMPLGTVLAYGGNTAPTGWHLCNGTAHGSSALQTLIGSANTPDLRDRFIVGAGNSYARGATGGVNTVTLSINEMPYHSHQIAVAGVTNPSSAPVNWDDVVGGDVNSGGTGPADPEYGANAIKPRGGGAAHENRPPYYALTYIIKKV